MSKEESKNFMNNNDFFTYLLLSNYFYKNNNKKETTKKKNKILSKEEIEKRTKIFEEARKNIKKEFFGIDDAIDQVFEQIKTWYIYPEYLTRPTIINLWGLTGVGKTDFVKKLRAFLRIEDFCDIETDSTADGIRDLSYRFCSDAGRGNSVLEYINMSNIDTTIPSIILFDEIHRFRTLNEKGELMRKEKFGDIWKFLSDGSLVDESFAIQILTEEIAKLDSRFNNIQTNLANNTEDINRKISYMLGLPVPKTDEEIKKENDLKDKFINEKGYIPYDIRKKMASELDDFNSGNNNNASLGYILGCIDIDDEDLDKLKSLQYQYQGYFNAFLTEIFSEKNDDEGKVSKYFKRCSNKVLLEWMKYKKDKMLERKNSMSPAELRMDVFICGNIPKKLYDDKKGNVTKEDVIEFLRKLFNPEQISRFGNNYIIYPILDKKIYDEIIEREITLMQDKMRSDFESDKITFDIQKVKEEVYNNLPKDFEYNGVRPVYSEVQRVLSKIIPYMVIKITEEKNKD